MTHDYLISLIRPAVPAAVDALLVPSTVHMRRVPALCRGYGKARGPGEGLAPGPRPRTSAPGRCESSNDFHGRICSPRLARGELSRSGFVLPLLWGSVTAWRHTHDPFAMWDGNVSDTSTEKFTPTSSV